MTKKTSLRNSIENLMKAKVGILIEYDILTEEN